MSVTKKAKKLIFDIAKKNKAFRIVFRGSRDAAYRAKMTLDDPFGKIDDKLVYFQNGMKFHGGQIQWKMI